MFGVDIRKIIKSKIHFDYFQNILVMEKDESDGYFRATLDLADGIFHYQFKSTKISMNKKNDLFCDIYSSNEIMV
jgi:hypothetical protein